MSSSKGSAELEQLFILIKANRGRAIHAMIQDRVLGNKRIFQFGEILDIPSVEALRESEYSKTHATLELFAYGTFLEYKANKERYLELTDLQEMKLKQLTIVSLAEKEKALSYETMQRDLDIPNVRAMEDLIIQSIFAGLVKGKLDQRAGIFRVTDVMGRDVPKDKIYTIIEKLMHWKQACGKVREAIVDSTGKLARQREAGNMEQAKIQEEAINQKAAIQLSEEQNEKGGGGRGDRGRGDDPYADRGMDRGYLGQMLSLGGSTDRRRMRQDTRRNI